MKKKFLFKFLAFLTLLSILLILYRFFNPSSINKISALYFFIPTILLILSIASLYSSEKLSFYISYALVAILISIYSIEVVYSFKKLDSIVKPRNNYFKKNNFETRDKFEIYKEILTKKLNKTISVPPQNFLKKNKSIFPMAGISKKNTIMCNESGYYNSYFADRYGFNNNDSIYDEKKILGVFVGDSFLHGACVNNKNNLISNLKKQNFFKNENIINFGYGGNGPLLSYATLREYFPKNKDVKYIIWLYYEANDLTELKEEYSDLILKKYIRNSNFSQNLVKKQSIIDQIITDQINYDKRDLKLNKKLNLKKIVSILSLDKVRSKIFHKFRTKYKKNQKIIKSFNVVAKEFKKFSDEINVNLFFIYLPGKYESEGAQYYEDITQIIRREKIKLLDLKDSNFIKKEEYYPKFGSHFNEKGYNELSKKINLFLSKNNY